MRAEVAYQLPGLSHLSRSSRRRRIAGISEVCRGRAAGVFGFIMTSSKLRKYLAYYQKTLREEPENIEARLRLAAVFRDMGREAHAIEEYATASRLLAREGLALEAIAACKAILELAPDHTDTLLFLARMYARVPDAAGGVARIARPLKAQSATDSGGWVPAPRHAPVDATVLQPYQLGAPKQRPDASPAPEPTVTSPFDGLPSVAPPASDTPNEGVTVVGYMDDEYEKFVASQRAAFVSSQPTQKGIGTLPVEDVRSTQALEATDRDSLLRASRAPSQPEERRDDLAELVETGDITAERKIRATHAGLRRTQDIDADDILLEVSVDDPVGEEIITNEFELGADILEDGAEVGLETFEAGVFNMKSLELDEPRSGQWDDLAFLDDLDALDEPSTAELHSMIDTGEPSPLVSVNRADLPHIPLFSDLDAPTFLQLLQLMEYRVVAPDTYIIEPGRTEPALFIIVRGAIIVERKLEGEQVELARMGEGEFFGEFALLTGRSESASVRAQGELAVLEVSAEVLLQVAEKDPKIWDVLWDFYYVRLLNNLLASSRLFRSMSDAARQELIAHFYLRELAPGELIARQGELDDNLYVICLGEVQVEMPRAGAAPRVIDTLGEGEFLGLISGATNQPMVADLRALSDTNLLVLPGEDFRRAVAGSAQIARALNEAVDLRQRKTDDD